MGYERISSIRWGKVEGHGGRILVTLPASCLERGRSSEKSKMAQKDFKVYLPSFFCIAGFQLFCFPTPSFTTSWILSSQRPSHNPKEFLLRKSSKRLSVSPFSWWLIPSSSVFIHFIAHISQQTNRILLTFTLKFELLFFYPGLSENSRPGPVLECPFFIPVPGGMKHQGWESHKHNASEYSKSVVSDLDFQCCPTSLCDSLQWLPKKRSSTSISVSKHLILCRCPTGTKVIRHWSARSWCCYCLIQPGFGVLINNFTGHQHWKRLLCAQDVFCRKVFFGFFFFW